MSSRTVKPVMRSAAWRISLWATLAFACGTMLVFIFLHRFVADDIQRRSDQWLSGEVEVLGDVAERTPKNALYDRVVGEV
ncbi:MAG: two-component sensor histidine kinase, partial [Candidatus Korobacteraceae bacterium]